jgi:hypothetical protein
MDPVMALLRDGVPITLLLDLADPTGPRSHEIYDLERRVPVTIALDADRFAPALA